MLAAIASQVGSVGPQILLFALPIPLLLELLTHQDGTPEHHSHVGLGRFLNLFADLLPSPMLSGLIISFFTL